MLLFELLFNNSNVFNQEASKVNILLDKKNRKNLKVN